MAPLSDELRANVSRMSDAELLKIASIDCGKHPTPTLLCAREELARRGLIDAPIGHAVSEDRTSVAATAAEAAIRYGGFWRRFGAYWLDVLFTLPLVAVSIWAQASTRYSYFWMLVPGLVFTFWYQIYLVRTFSGTPGKLVLNLKISRVDGSAVGYREAILRHAVDFALGHAVALALAMATLRIPESEYFALSFLARSRRIVASAPWWYSPVHLLFNVWIWSEFIVMLTNRKRRALHDFLAGTVVIHAARALPAALNEKSGT